MDSLAEAGVIGAMVATVLALSEVIKNLASKKNGPSGRQPNNTPAPGTIAAKDVFNLLQEHSHEDERTLRMLAETQAKFVEAAKTNGKALEGLGNRIEKLQEAMLIQNTKLDQLIARE